MADPLDETSIHPALNEITTSNGQEVKIGLGDFDVIGSDVDDYHFGKVEEIHQTDEGCYLSTIYHEPNTDTGQLKAAIMPRKRNTARRDDNCPLNSVIMNIGQSGVVEEETVQKICDLTAELYG